jgi:hypothetical protein
MQVVLWIQVELKGLKVDRVNCKRVQALKATRRRNLSVSNTWRRLRQKVFAQFGKKIGQSKDLPICFPRDLTQVAHLVCRCPKP